VALFYAPCRRRASILLDGESQAKKEVASKDKLGEVGVGRRKMRFGYLNLIYSDSDSRMRKSEERREQ